MRDKRRRSVTHSPPTCASSGPSAKSRSRWSRVAFMMDLQADAAPFGAFDDRADAGRRLATALMHLKDENPIVLALPRGGVPVAFEAATALSAPLDVILVRKIGAPRQKELGLGAVVDGPHPQIVLNEDVVRIVRPGDDYIRQETEREMVEIERRRALYRHNRPPVEVTGHTVIVVDDGI